MKPLDPITYDYSGLIAPKDAPPFVQQTGLVEADLKWLAPRLAAARQEVLDDLALYEQGGPVPDGNAAAGRRLLRPARAAAGRGPAAAGSDHRHRRPAGQGGRSRGGAGHRRLVHGRPGAVRGLLPSVPQRDCRASGAAAGRGSTSRATTSTTTPCRACSIWSKATTTGAIIVISKSGGTLETAVAFRIFLDALRKSCGGDEEKLRRRVVPVTGETGRLRDLAKAIGCHDIFPIPDGVGGRFSILSAVGLLPAAVMGLDVVTSARRRGGHERALPHGRRRWKIPCSTTSASRRLMETRRGATIRVLSTWGKGLEAVGLWYDQLLSESLGKNGQGATPLTVVNTRDLHSRGQQHQEGRRDKLITNLVVEQHGPRAGRHRAVGARPGQAQRAGRQDAARHLARGLSPARTRPTPTTTAARPRSACRGSTKARSASSSRCSCWPRSSKAGWSASIPTASRASRRIRRT